jgi:hypothetical protein
MPLENQGPGTNTITTVVSDGLASVTNSFVVTVLEANVAPVILSLEWVNSTNVVLTWTAEVDVTYQVRYRTNWSEGAWATLGPGITATNSTASVVDAPGEDPQRFYQVMIPTPGP